MGGGGGDRAVPSVWTMRKAAHSCITSTHPDLTQLTHGIHHPYTTEGD